MKSVPPRCPVAIITLHEESGFGSEVSASIAEITAVVVTYCPNLQALGMLLSALRGQVGSVVIVDNGSDGSFRRWLDERVGGNEVLIALGDNLGVAAAQNNGIEWARRHGMTHVILFDQDSIPEPEMVSQLLRAIRQKIALGIRVAAVGPRYEDERNKKHPSFIRVTGFKAVKDVCNKSGKIIESDIVISSGCLIPLAALEKVGGLLDDLFIDQVDIEWCLRAKSLGYQAFGVCDAVMRHSLGEEPKTFFRRKILHHGPLRHYYIFRNAVWLLFQNYVPMGWKFLFIRTILVRLVLYGCLVPPRLTYLKMMTQGIWHGLVGRLGKLEVKDRCL